MKFQKSIKSDPRKLVINCMLISSLLLGHLAEAKVTTKDVILAWPSAKQVKVHPNCRFAIVDALRPLLKELGLSPWVLEKPKMDGNVLTVQEEYKLIIENYQIIARGLLYKGSGTIFQAFAMAGGGPTTYGWRGSGGQFARGTSLTYSYDVFRGELINPYDKTCRAVNTELVGIKSLNIAD